MKSSLYLILLILIAQSIFAQDSKSVKKLGHLSYNERVSDVWGFKHSDGTEYALVGRFSGLSIVSLANPHQPQEVQFIPGGQTSWRDIKTYGNYAYITSEQVWNGVLVVNLSGLPNQITYQYKYLATNVDTVFNSHNLYIDENGFCYIAGANIEGGAPLIFDLRNNPENPVYVGTVGTEYAHDVYVRGDTLWGSNIAEGHFSVYDIRNKQNPVLLATQNTSSNFTHNAWPSDNGKTLFTTDERRNGFVDAYDVSDLGNIRLLDKWQPQIASLKDVIPHNVHVRNDYLIVSYYTEGVIILDAKHPDNLVEVAYLRTYNGSNIGYYGCWGAYPLLPSGLCLASDINTGLHVFRPFYKRGCRLEGVVTDQSTGAPLFDVQVEIKGTGIIKKTILSGQYKIGIGESGSYEVTYRKLGYLPKTITVPMVNDQIRTRNIELIPATPFLFTGKVIDANTTQGIPFAEVRIEHSGELNTYDLTTDANGNFSLNIYEEEYKILAGSWGHVSQQNLSYFSPISPNNSVVIALAKGYYDDFALDLGWSVSGDISMGAWEIAAPSSVYQWTNIMPKADNQSDLGKYCYLTGVSDSRSDSGQTILESPSFDASLLSDPAIGFHYWWTSLDSTYSGTLDQLELWLDNGTSSVLVTNYLNGNYNWSEKMIYRLSDYLSPTNNMRVRFVMNNSHARNFAEAAIDKFEVQEFFILSNLVETANLDNNSVSLSAFPSPFGQQVTVEYNILNRNDLHLDYLVVSNLLGQVIERHSLKNNNGSITLGTDWPNGVYIIHLGNASKKIIKASRP